MALLLQAACSPTRAISKHAFSSPQSEKLLEPLARIEMPVVRVLAEVEAKGIAANPAILAAQKYGSDAAHVTANASHTAKGSQATAQSLQL